MEHMAKLGSMLVKHKEESNNWKGCIGPKIEEKVQQKIAKGEVYPVTPFMNGIFGVSFGTTFLNVDIIKRTCTCRGWEMLGIPCEHAVAVILSIGQNVVDFVQDWYKFPMQELIYSGSFSGIETMTCQWLLKMVWFDLSPVKFSSLLTHPIPNGLPADQERSALSPNFKINGLSFAQDVILPGTIGKRATTLCLKCNAITFFHD
ncbi:hypothetical protein CK203_062566 [Vitis vinifera]|uniref:SWIM-type domain-containing protein n=1 Tax=Vitis vinifera TaxID=29760 RepID=A0A438FYL6_VITVI|nr:hypothetical protein CK203_062566 [Vitis vinifera]